MNPIRMIKNLIKIAKLVSVTDTGNLQFATVSMLGKEQKVMMLKPYGLMSNPPADSLVAIFSQQGQESNGIGIADDPKNRLFTSMTAGEVAIGNYTSGAATLYNASGEQEINGNSDNLVTWTDLNTVLQAAWLTYNGHRHGGSANDSPVTLDLTGARADTLKTDG